MMVVVDQEKQRLLVDIPSGQVMEVDPGRCPLKSVYTVQEIAIAPRVQLRWTQNDRVVQQRNDQRFTIQKIEPDETVHIIDSKGQISQANHSSK